MNNFIVIANNYIGYLQKFPLNRQYQIAIKTLYEFVKSLRGLPNQKPAKEELKITIDVIKEITKLSAKTEDQKQFIDISCELVKVFIDKEGK